MFSTSSKLLLRGAWPPSLNYVNCHFMIKNAQDDLQTPHSLFGVLKILPKTPPSNFDLHV